MPNITGYNFCVLNMLRFKSDSKKKAKIRSPRKIPRYTVLYRMYTASININNFKKSTKQCKKFMQLFFLHASANKNYFLKNIFFSLQITIFSCTIWISNQIFIFKLVQIYKYYQGWIVDNLPIKSTVKFGEKKSYNNFSQKL